VSELRDAVADIWLVDAQGHWLLGPKDDGTFAAAYPDVWRQMQSLPTGTIETEFGHFSYAQTDGDPTGAGGGQPQPSWFVLVPTPRAFSDALTSALKFNFAVATGGLLALLGGISLGMARHQIHRRESEQFIRLSEARFRAVTETASDAIISADRDGIIRYFNPARRRSSAMPSGT
jgi:PAS domain-containing protein